MKLNKDYKIDIDIALFNELKPQISLIHNSYLDKIENIVQEGTDDGELACFTYQILVNSYLLDKFKSIKDYELLLEFFKLNSLCSEHLINHNQVVSNMNCLEYFNSYISILTKYTQFMSKYYQLTDKYDIPTSLTEGNDIPIFLNEFDHEEQVYEISEIFNFYGLLIVICDQFEFEERFIKLFDYPNEEDSDSDDSTNDPNE